VKRSTFQDPDIEGAAQVSDTAVHGHEGVGKLALEREGGNTNRLDNCRQIHPPDPSRGGHEMREYCKL